MSYAKIKRGDMLEACRCPGCGNDHPCGKEDCLHEFFWATETAPLEPARQIEARGRGGIPTKVWTSDVVAFAWAGWVPEDLEEAYDEWCDSESS